MAIARCAPTAAELDAGGSVDVPTTAFIAKMVAVPAESLPTNKRVQQTAEQLREQRRRTLAASTTPDAIGPAGQVRPQPNVGGRRAVCRRLPDET